LRNSAAASLAAVVSWGGEAAGSAVMILTGGIEADEGKYRVLADFDGAPGVVAVTARGGSIASGLRSGADQLPA